METIPYLNDIKSIIGEVFGLNCLFIEKLNGYDDFNFHIKCEKLKDTKIIDNIPNNGFILKIINPLDSENIDLIDGLTKLLLHLNCKNVCCPKPVKTTLGDFFVKKKIKNNAHILRLFEFIDGTILAKIINPNYELFIEIGKFIADLNINKLKDFSNEHVKKRRFPWMLEEAPNLIGLIDVFRDDCEKQETIKNILREFSECLKNCRKFEKGYIHGDFNEQNLLIDKINNEWHVKGILDFGDCHYSCYLFELAIAMAYLILYGNNIEIGKYILAGYSEIRPLPQAELKLLKICIEARLCQSLVMGANAYEKDPTNFYLLTTSKSGWTMLMKLRSKSNEEILNLWGK